MAYICIGLRHVLQSCVVHNMEGAMSQGDVDANKADAGPDMCFSRGLKRGWISVAAEFSAAQGKQPTWTCIGQRLGSKKIEEIKSRRATQLPL
jgi:hypothetical protein